MKADMDPKGWDGLESEAVKSLAQGMTEVLRLVRFSDVEEFLRELDLQRRDLALPYVRVTAHIKHDSQFPVIAHLTTVAGFWGKREYVELRTYCGQMMEHDDKKAAERYALIQKMVKAYCEKLGIEVRAGRWTQGKEG